MSDRTANTREGLTWRALTIGLVVTAATAPFVYYLGVQIGSRTWHFAIDAPSEIPVTLLFALTAAMGLPLLRRVGLTRSELLVIYAMLMVAVPLSNRFVLFFMLPKTPLYFYMGRAHPDWDAGFLKYIPSWWAPTDAAALEGFSSGGGSVPWGHWWLPALAWLSSMFCLWLATMCILVLVQRQWIQNERLTFPVAQVPLHMVGEPGAAQGQAACLAVAGLFPLGLALGFGLSLLNYLSKAYPWIPALDIDPRTVWQPEKVGLTEGVEEVSMCLWPWLLGLTYLVPKEISLSGWFFWIAHQVVTVTTNAMGLTAQEGARGQALLPAAYQGAGAVYALLLWVLWAARRHLVAVVRAALGLRGDELDPEEQTLYRWAMIGLGVSVSWMVYLLWLSGCRVSFAITFLVLTIGYYLLWARLRAETGVVGVSFPIGVDGLITEPFGTARLRVSEIVTLFTMRWATYPVPSATVALTAGGTIEAFKIADVGRVRVSRMAAALVAAFALSALVGSYVLLRGMYHHGYFGLVEGAAFYDPSKCSREDGETIHSLLVNPRPALGPNAFLAALVGGVLAVGVGIMRLRFWWWPFHPIGIIVAGGGGGDYLFPFFISWAVKSLVVRYGGLRLYRRTVPLAIGLIVGDKVNSGALSILAAIAGTKNE